MFPCWDPTTLADELDQAALPWAFYAVPLKAKGSGSGKLCGSGIGSDGNGYRSAIWSAYQAIKHVCYGKDWNKRRKIATAEVPQRCEEQSRGSDVGHADLRNLDHGGNNSDTGPSWVSSVVNAVGESQFWSSTAIFIFWDDPGGWYDPEPRRTSITTASDIAFRC